MSGRKELSGQAGVRAHKAEAKMREAEGGWAAYRAEAAARDAKTSRLRALRLARELEQAVAAEPPRKPKPAKRARG
jgi:hypothetical protein